MSQVHDIPLDKAYLVSLFVEAILYGAYTILFGLCVYVLLKRKSNGTVNKPFLITAILTFVLCTAHIVVEVVRAIQAFSDEGSSDPQIPYYNQAWLPLDIIRQVLMVAATLVTDTMVAYRCYLIWSCQWKVIVAPAMLLLASTVTAVVSVYNFSQLQPGQPFLNTTNINWGYASFILWLVTIVLVTSLIVYRLRSIARQTEEILGEDHGNKYNYIMTVILESGIIYAFSALVLLILCITRSVYQAIAFDAVVPITGITTTLIIVRVGLGTITEGVTTDDYGSKVTSRDRPRRLPIFNAHTSGSEKTSTDPLESAVRVDSKVV